MRGDERRGERGGEHRARLRRRASAPAAGDVPTTRSSGRARAGDSLDVAAATEPRERRPRARLRSLAGALALACATSLSACARPPAPRAETNEHRRVASQTVLSDEILWALGPETQARVIAVSPLVDDPRYSTIPGAWPPALPRLAGSSESLLALAPDLVIIASFTAPETRVFLEAHHVETLELDAFTGFDDLWRHTRAIAAAVDAEAAGEALIAGQEARLAALRRDHDRGRRPAAVSWGDGMIAARDTSFDAIAGAAGLDNLAAARGLVGHVPLTIEELTAWDPEVIVIGCEPPGCEAAERELAGRPGIAATRAAREGGIIALPAAALASTGEGMIVAAELLSARRLALPEAP